MQAKTARTAQLSAKLSRDSAAERRSQRSNMGGVVAQDASTRCVTRPRRRRSPRARAAADARVFVLD